MKIIYLSLAVTVTILASTFAQAAKPALVPSFKGKINNYSNHATNTFVVNIALECYYKAGVIWPDSKSCGSQRNTLAVQADGTFVVPNMAWQQKSSIGNYRFSLSLSTKSGAPIAFAGFHAKEIRSAPAKLAQISVYEMPALKVNVATPTGENYAAWRGMINHPSETVKDPCVELIFNVEVADGYSLTDEHEVSAVRSDKAVAGVIPSAFLATKGNPGRNLPVKGSLYYRSSKPQCQVNQDKVKFENAETLVAPISELYQHFNNSSYRVD